MNYGSAAAYRKAMGLNLKERSSGKHKGKLSLSKRGQRLTRKWLYFSALRWTREPSVKRWIQRKKERRGWQQSGGRRDAPAGAGGVARRTGRSLRPQPFVPRPQTREAQTGGESMS